MALSGAAALLRAYGPDAAVEEALAFIDAHPDCLWRTCLEGHLTGSAWIVSPDRTQALLVHHRKLGRWLQPGGHADGDGDLAAVARREAQEETGLRDPRLVRPELFDFDAHRIPARKTEPEHWHFDFRFLFEADPNEPLVVSDESHAVRWFPVAEIERFEEESMRRLARKTR